MFGIGCSLWLIVVSGFVLSWLYGCVVALFGSRYLGLVFC